MANLSSLIQYSDSSAQKGKFNLVCFCYAGGSADIFKTWPDDLGDTFNVYAMQWPGRAARVFEEPHQTMDDMVSEVLSLITTEGIVIENSVFFGHSLGGMVAWNLTKKLQQLDDGLPLHLFVSASRPPHIPVKRQPIHHLSFDDFVVELRKLKGTPEEILQNNGIMELLEPGLRADFKVAYENQSPAVLVNCGITVFYGTKDDHIQFDEIKRWQDLTTNVAEFKSIEGDHFFVNTQSSLLTQLIKNHVNKIIKNSLKRLRSRAVPFSRFDD